MILDEELWMNIRRYRSLHAAGATYAEIALECGVDWRTVKKYLAGAIGPAGRAVAGRDPASGDHPGAGVADPVLAGEGH